MARISGMLLGLGMLVVISSMVSPASAWDGDDDDNHKRHRKHHKRHGHHDHFDRDDDHYGRHPHHFAPLRVYVAPRYVEHDHFGGYGAPYYQPTPAAPLAPPPLAPSELPGNSYLNAPETIIPPIPPSELPGSYSPEPSNPIIVPPIPPTAVLPGLPQERPGQFVDHPVPLYPLVRVENGDKVPRYAIHQVIAVRSPDPLRFPGCVYVQICVPPTPCRDVKVEDRGSKIELKYGEYEVEIKSGRGLVTVEYDD